MVVAMVEELRLQSPRLLYKDDQSWLTSGVTKVRYTAPPSSAETPVVPVADTITPNQCEAELPSSRKIHSQE